MRILMLIFFVFVSSLLHAQRDLEVSSSDPKRIALVIGNGAYQYGNPLTNTLNDADAITRTLQGVGFDVIKVKNASLQELETKLNEFTTRIESGNYAVALCFYSGHGIQVGGENYLIPVDANPQREADVKYQCLNAQQIIDHMSEARAATKIMLLDACRNNPLPKTWNRSGGKGLAYMFAPRGTFIGFATAPGTEASDGIGNNSPYTSAILKYLNTPGLDIHQVFTRV
ncbi:MAG: caspase family protein, partial [Saprospiraceae bacterium]|nr:caspase family protein [Saprospiraceae bacterium]